MSKNYTVNPSSLNIIKKELMEEIQQTGSYIEQFISNRDKEELHQQAIESLATLRGVFSLIQLYGADDLAQEMLGLLNTIPVGADQSFDNALGELSTAVFILPRYFEYTQQAEKCLPVLLLPFINDIRVASGKGPVSESQFMEANIDAQRPSPPAGSIPAGDEFVQTVRRLRHMFQVGLLGILQDKKAGYSMGLMKRSMERLDKICGDKAVGKMLWLGSVAFDAMEQQKMPATKPRKFLFSAIDRKLKAIVKKGIEELDVPVDEQILRELVFIVAVSGLDSDKVKEVKNTFAVMPLEFDDAKLQEELDNLRGPEMGTVHSVAEVIREELRNTKNRLESAAEGVGLIDGYPEIVESLKRVTDILMVVGLETASKALQEQVDSFQKWADDNHEADREDLISAADALLYVESTVANLEHINLSPEKLKVANALAKDEVIASSQLAEAEKVVLEEAQAGLSLVKRGINSFMESGYDRNHIANLGKSLNSVRGAMIVLNMPKAAEITDCSVKYVENDLLKGDLGGTMEQMLETFADCVISLEYYIENYADVGVKDESILEIAEECVKALGYPLPSAEG